MIMKKLIILFPLILLINLVLLAEFSEEKEIIRVKKDSEVVQTIMDMNMDILWQKQDQIFILAGVKDLIKLENTGIAYSIESENFSGSEDRDIFSQGGVNGAYHSYLELEHDLFLLEHLYPQLAKVEIIGNSHEQRHIYAIKISDHVLQQENEAQIIFLGCHHAREWISVEVPYLLGKYLLENYQSDSDIKKLVNQSEVWIIPMVNPDGLVYSIYFYRYWRKNRRNNNDGTYGVDLNRNYGYKWGNDNIGSSPDPFSSLYRGPYAFSEPETKAIRDFMTGKNFKALVSYHNYSQIIIYPWGYTNKPSHLDNLMHCLSEKMSNLIQGVNGNVYGYSQAGDSLYLTNGDTTDWSLGVFGIPSFTIELPPADILSGAFYNSEINITPIFQENLPAALYLIKWVIKHYSQENTQDSPKNFGQYDHKSRDRSRK